jgi:hypothetical protein
MGKNRRFSENSQSIVEEIAGQIASKLTAGAGETAAVSTDGRAEIRRLARRDYGKALRDLLGRWEVQEILREGEQTVWPGLNKRAVKLVSPEEFSRHWSAFKVNVKFAKLSKAEELSLLGFYVKDATTVGQRPLIWVNTAHHPAIVGAALAHEMGHHVVHQIFDLDGSGPQFLARTGFEGHLTDPAELAADLLVSAGIYPNGLAQELFHSGPVHSSSKVPLDSNSNFTRVLTYVARTYGLQFDKQLEPEKQFYALAALIHYTKIRQALLDEYDM